VLLPLMANNRSGGPLNCFGYYLVKMNSPLRPLKTINTHYVIDFLEQILFSIIKPTVVILDNAHIHTPHKIKE
jgi:hypothetical protein